MLPFNRNYAIFPSVFEVGKETEIKILGCGRAFFPFEGEEYDITLIPVDADVLDYHNPDTHIKIKAKASGGVIRFNYTPEREQGHLVYLEKDGKKLGEFSAYALNSDLYSCRPLKGDFHVHSYRSDGTIDPSNLIGHYRSEGYDFFSLTDHNRFYPGFEADEVFEGVKTGFVRVNGEEVHAPGCDVHIVNNGSENSVAAIYLNDKDRYDREVEGILARLPESVPERYRERYAKILWVVENIHREGGLATFAHPFWRPGSSRTHNVCEEFTRILLEKIDFDAFELIGAGTEAERNCITALWNDLRAEGTKIPVVGSSDVHSIGVPAQSFSNYFTICFAKENEAEEIKSAVKEGLSVAVCASGYGYDRGYQCNGSYRLVAYSRFLLEKYFPEQQRILEGQGELMRRYSVGEDSSAAIENIAHLAEENYERFFGKREPLYPTKEMLEFEDKWREVQMAGPHTKGSHIYGSPETRQI